MSLRCLPRSDGLSATEFRNRASPACSPALPLPTAANLAIPRTRRFRNSPRRGSLPSSCTALVPAPFSSARCWPSGRARVNRSAAANPTVAQGQRLYVTYCATCHGPTGNGYAADNSPSLRTTTFLATATDAFLDAAITRGRPGTAMAAFGRALGGPLAPADVTAIVAFLRDGAPPLVPLPSAPVAGDPKAGETVYTNVCARCHGTKTQRSSAVHLANPILLQTASDAFLRYAVVSGRPPTTMIPWAGRAHAEADRRRGRLRPLHGHGAGYPRGAPADSATAARRPRRGRDPSSSTRAGARRTSRSRTTSTSPSMT